MISAGYLEAWCIFGVVACFVLSAIAFLADAVRNGRR